MLEETRTALPLPGDDISRIYARAITFASTMSSTVTPDLTSSSLTSILRRLGCQTLKATELYNFNEHNLSLNDYKSFLLFYRWIPNPPDPPWNAERASVQTDREKNGNIWFANQIIDNAAAVQALVMAVMNIQNTTTEIGEGLEKLRVKTKWMPNELKSVVVCAEDRIEQVIEEINKEVVAEDGDVWYYTVWVLAVESDGSKAAYRLDSTSEVPKCVGDIWNESPHWTEFARHDMMSKIEMMREHGIEFRAFAIVPTDVKTAEESNESLKTHQEDVREQKQEQGQEEKLESKKEVKFEDDPDESRDMDTNLMELREAALSRTSFNLGIEHREKPKAIAKPKRGLRKEDRRHNFEPFLTAMIKTLASKGVLLRLVDRTLADIEDDDGYYRNRHYGEDGKT